MSFRLNQSLILKILILKRAFCFNFPYTCESFFFFLGLHSSISFFKDSSFNNKPALFICKDKDDKDTRATTLIFRPPMIRYFSKKWESRKRPFNLPEWSMAISHGPDTSSRITLLLASHHTDTASSRSYSSLG